MRKKILFLFLFILIFIPLLNSETFGYNNPTLPQLINPNAFFGNFTWNGNCLDGGVEIRNDGTICGQRLEIFNLTSVNITKQNLTILTDLVLDGFTQGSALFIGSDSQILEDNSNFFWDNSNKRLGIGTNLPLETFNVLGDSLFEGNITMEGNEFVVGFGGAFYPEDFSSGSLISISPSAEEDAALTMGGLFSAFHLWFENGGDDGYIDILGDSDNSDIFFRTKVDGTPINAMTIKGSGKIGIGTTTPQDTLNVIGDINATADIYSNGQQVISYQRTVNIKNVTMTAVI